MEIGLASHSLHGKDGLNDRLLFRPPLKLTGSRERFLLMRQKPQVTGIAASFFDEKKNCKGASNGKGKAEVLLDTKGNGNHRSTPIYHVENKNPAISSFQEG